MSCNQLSFTAIIFTNRAHSMCVCITAEKSDFSRSSRTQNQPKNKQPNAFREYHSNLESNERKQNGAKKMDSPLLFVILFSIGLLNWPQNVSVWNFFKSKHNKAQLSHNDTLWLLSGIFAVFKEKVSNFIYTTYTYIVIILLFHEIFARFIFTICYSRFFLLFCSKPK